MTKRPILLLAVSLLLASSVGAQAPFRITEQMSGDPKLSDMMKLQLANAMQKVEIAQLRMTQAVTEAQALVKQVQVPGYTLDLATLTYAPEKPAEKPAAKE